MRTAPHHARTSAGEGRRAVPSHSADGLTHIGSIAMLDAWNDRAGAAL
ncbi:hypothetical protein [Sphingomonas dokdonensis]|nr:hypothetical protein [Sphingomonas dokdonensis]